MATTSWINSREYEGKHYYLATRKGGTTKWSVTPYSFLLHYNSAQLFGQFITTNWFNMLCMDKTPLDIIILAVSKDASRTDKQEIVRYLNTNNTSPYMIYHCTIDENAFAEAIDHISSKLDEVDKNVSDKPCKTYNIKIGHENIDQTTIQFVVQGSWQSDDRNKYMYTITLPNFQTRL
tara:strand:- start:209 stop:742 length:534 start_codon:yes stop_codon:yes gene_type:complete